MQARREHRLKADPGINGILNISKEAGYTSFDVVAVVRGVYRQRKCGHTGTLDPMATGVLPVALGKATKVCGMLTDWDKEYEAELLLGRTTDTLDVTGEDNGGDPEAAMNLDEDSIRAAVLKYRGVIEQIPPMYSALKKDGRRLYDIARSGGVVERQARTVTIHSIEVLAIEKPIVKIRVLCSKGTYIRSLCDDIGRDLQCGGCMKALKRTAVGPFNTSNAVSLDMIKKLRDEGREDELMGCLMPLDMVFAGLGKLTVKQDSEKMLSNGNKLSSDDVETDIVPSDHERFRIYHLDGSFAAVYEYDSASNMYKPYRMF